LSEQGEDLRTAEIAEQTRVIAAVRAGEKEDPRRRAATAGAADFAEMRDRGRIGGGECIEERANRDHDRSPTGTGEGDRTPRASQGP
jgi:hypothetical protein